MKLVEARTKFRLGFVVSLLFCCASIVAGQVRWFEDSFVRAELGSGWKAASGDWKIRGGILRIQTKEYDQLLASSYYIYNLQPYSIEVTLRGNRAGVYFSLDDRGSKFLSQMVRFDDNSVLTGYFNGAGEFTATNTFNVAQSPTDWTTLRIDVNPKRNRYDIFVNGIAVGVDDHLVFPSGYLGLEASDGVAEFKSVRVFGRSRVRTPSKPRIGRRPTFQHVRFVEIDGKNIRLYNPELRLWQTFNPDGKVIRQEPAKKIPQEVTQVTFGNRLYSIENGKVYVKAVSGKILDSLTERLIAPSTLLVDSRGKTPVLDVADCGANAVLQFTLRGRFLGAIDGSAIGGFKAPRGIALYGSTGLVIADYDKVVLYDPKVDTQSVTVTPVSPSEAQVTWYSSAMLHTFVDFAPDGGTWKRLNRVSVQPSGRRSAILRDLQPLTRYSFRVSPTLNTIPEGLTHSTMYRFVTPSADTSAMAITRLPVMCMVYRTISYRDKYPKDKDPQIPDGRRMTDEEIQYLKRATEFNRGFYFRNSGCRFVIDFDFYVVEDTLWLHELGDSDPYWLSCNARVTKDFETAAHHFGKSPEYYAGLICPYAWVNYPPRRRSALSDPSKTDSINIRQAVGGGTNGVPAPWKYGKTTGYTANPFQDEFSRQDWLITHEFNHQVDALMDASGYPEYYHADMPWKMPGRFGEDFDFNAHIIRNAPKGSWLALRFGYLAQTADADHDGVPDDDPSLPFDEKRLKGNPYSKDTDGDGLDDLHEVMAGTSRGTELNNKDTDGDGLADNVDPEPLYPTNPAIAKLANLDELQAVPFATVETKDLRGTTYLRWDDRYLYFRANTNEPANLLIQIDADNDGWFHSFDNFQGRVMNNGDSTWVADYYLRDCSSWKDAPKDRRDIVKRSDLIITSRVDTAQSSGGKTGYSVTVQIPRNDKYGMQLEPGKKMSVRFGLQTRADLWVWDELFERNYMMTITLQ